VSKRRRPVAPSSAGSFPRVDRSASRSAGRGAGRSAGRGIADPAVARGARVARIAVVLLAVAPVVLLPGGMDRWTFPKLLLAAAGVLVAAWAPASGRLGRTPALLVAAGCVVLGVSALTGESPLAQLLGRWPRYEGAVAASAYLGAMWAGARLLGPAAPVGRVGTLFRALSWASVAVTAIAICEALGWDPIPSDLTRAGSLLGNASNEGSFGVVLAAVLGVVAFSAASTVPVRIGFAAAVLTTILSASRTAEAALFALLLVGVVVLVLRARRRLVPWPLALVAAGVVVTTVALTLAVPLARTRIVDTASTASGFGASRGLLWQAALRVIGTQPVIGVGPSGFLDALPGHQTAALVHATGVGVTTDSPHNAELQLLSAGGVLLLVIAVALGMVASVAAARGIRAEQRFGGTVPVRLAAAAGVGGWLLTLQTTFTAPANAILPMLLLGVVLSVPVGAAVGSWSARQRRAASVAARVGFAVPVLVLLAATIAEVPLQLALDDAGAGRLDAVRSDYAVARVFRPWDADVTLLEAQTLTQLASAGLPGAAPAAVEASRSAVATFPDSVLGLKALAAALEFDGQDRRALAVAQHLDRVDPHDPEVAARIREIRAAIAGS
jgi:O-antigen ligase